MAKPLAMVATVTLRLGFPFAITLEVISSLEIPHGENMSYSSAAFPPLASLDLEAFLTSCVLSLVCFVSSIRCSFLIHLYSSGYSFFMSLHHAYHL